MMRGLSIASGAMLLVCVLSACNSADFRTDIEDRVNIMQGIYGQITAIPPPDNDPQPSYWAGLYLYLFVEEKDEEQEQSEETYKFVGEVRSGSEGFYQFPMEAGSYQFCTESLNCTDITIATGDLRRLDYKGGSGSGWTE
jgi:hypothetical protein